MRRLRGALVIVFGLAAGTALAQPSRHEAAIAPTHREAASAGTHPAYVHAIEDVELAYHDVSTRGGARDLRPHESAAMNHLHTAADYLRGCAQAVGKSYHSLPHPDVSANNKVALLHDSLAYVDRAISDTSGTESDAKIAAQRQDALNQLSEAKSEINAAISDYDRDSGRH